MFAGEVGQVVQRPAGQQGRSTKYHAPARVPAPRTRLQAQVVLGINLQNGWIITDQVLACISTEV
jgi:hypothetical protein